MRSEFQSPLACLSLSAALTWRGKRASCLSCFYPRNRRRSQPGRPGRRVCAGTDFVFSCWQIAVAVKLIMKQPLIKIINTGESAYF